MVLSRNLYKISLLQHLFNDLVPSSVICKIHCSPLCKIHCSPSAIVSKVEKKFGCQKKKYHEDPEKKRQAVKKGYHDQNKFKKQYKKTNISGKSCTTNTYIYKYILKSKVLGKSLRENGI